jgi:hypothetical protein
MKKILTSIVALLAWAGTSMAQTNALSVADILLPNKGDATLKVDFQFDAADTYTAVNFNVELPSDLEFVLAEGTDVAYEKGDSFDESHGVTANLSEGLAKVVCMSLKSAPFKGTSGYLMGLTIKPKTANLTAGTTYTGKIKDILIVPVIGDKKSLSDVTFTITIDDRIGLDENSKTAPKAISGVDVRVTRTINANEWSTICLPFAMTAAQVKAAFGDDVKLGDFDDYDTEDEGNDVIGITLNFSAATAIEANHPYILKTSSAITSFEVDGVDIDPEDEPCVEYDNGLTGKKRVVYGTFYGTYVAETEIPATALFLSGNKFYYSKGATKSKAFRGYFDLMDVLSGYDISSVRFGMTFDDATGIQNVNVQNEGEAIYNLNGLRVKTPAKGLYIKNGKKVIIK